MTLKFTKPVGLTAALLLFLAAVEAGVPVWRHNVPVSTAAVFSLPMASEAMQHPGSFQRSIDLYHADRGGELKLPGPDDSSLAVFYFEWNMIEAGPMMDITGHRPEICNVAAGFKLLSINAKRFLETPGQSSLEFDSTTFADPGGKNVHVFKNAWLQGFGSRDVREGEAGLRNTRLKNAFVRGRGAARVIECGVSGAQDESQAWQIFQEQVLQQLVWK